MTDISVKIGNEKIFVAPGTTLLEISKKYQKKFSYPILVAKMDNEVADLSRIVTPDSNIIFYDRTSRVGNEVYMNSLKLLLIVSLKRLFGNVDVLTDFSIDNGVFCQIMGKNLSKQDLSKLENTMKKVSEEGLEYIKISVSRLEAIKYFKKKNNKDKVNLLKYISNTYVNLYILDNNYDYFFGALAHNTKDIDDFKIFILDKNKFILSAPTTFNPKSTVQYNHHTLLFDTYYKYNEWGRKIKINTVSELNNFIVKGDYNQIVRISEAHYDSQLSDIADDIYRKKKKPKMILLAGPSSSGKTTTSKKLSVYLRARGFTPCPITMDNYFLDRKDIKLDTKGEKNFENLSAVDLKLFNEQMRKLLNGEEVSIPEYDFVEGKKKYKDKKIKMESTDILVIEGIHALNPLVGANITRDKKYKIYISPLTLINIDYHNQIHTTDTRKLRRIVRDNKYRAYTATETLKQWPKITEGEEKNIYPYQNDVDNIINSALVYEISVLKTYAEPLLFSVSEDDEVYPEAIRLVNILRNFLPIPSDAVPKDSVLREFIGGSGFYE